MFEDHSAPAADKILRIMGLFAEDPRHDKIDLGVGVYRTAGGQTPIPRAVKRAEERLLAKQTTKGYVGLAGDPAFHAVLRELVLADSVAPERVAALATPGGTGAVRQTFELVRSVRPNARVWASAPTWPNHEAILNTLGMPWTPYRYYDPATGGLDRTGMLADIDRAAAGDVVLLHGCCHNPTGADLTLSDWAEIAEILLRRGAVPMIDLAYQGFGTGLDEDAAGLRQLAARMPEMLLTISGSKNFGLYRERVGLVLAICENTRSAKAVSASLAGLNRQAFAFPPDHGARVVTEILTEPELRADWTAELDEMRARVQTMRTGLVEALRRETGSDRFGFLAAHKGMFSLLPATPQQVESLRQTHAVYAIDDGRINLAGLTPDTIAPAARAIARTLA